MAAQAEFQAGDHVKIVDSPNAELNGLEGVLKKAVGSGKWAVVVKSLGDKSKVVGAQYLERVEVFDPTSIAYSVVGTWDDWEAHEMAWDPIKERYEFSVVLGSEGVESFKVLLDEDWDSCVYPAESDANTYDGFELRGPDDGEDGGEWTIGKHPDDLAQPEACYKIILYVENDGTPSKIDWEHVSGQKKAKAPKAEDPDAYPAAAEAPPARRPAAREEYEPPARRPAAREEYEQPVMRMQELPVVSKHSEEDDENRRGGYGRTRKGLFSQWQRDNWEEDQRRRHLSEEKEREIQVLEEEKAARQRLQRRLEAAQNAELLQLQDEQEAGRDTIMYGQDDVQARLARNHERLDELEGLEAGAKKQFVEYQQRLPYLYEKLQEQKRLASGDGAYRAAEARSSKLKLAVCLECDQTTEVMTNGSCQKCWDAYLKLQKAGWSADVLCDGAAAGLRCAEVKQKNPEFTKDQCRRKVMEEHSAAFQIKKRLETKSTVSDLNY